MAEVLGFPHRAQHDALRRLRHELSDAITSRSLDADDWVGELCFVLTKLGRIFGKHIAETESSNGSLSEIQMLKSQLGMRVRRIKEEHVALRSRIDELCAKAKCQTVRDYSVVEELRGEAGKLVDAIQLHQATGVDLVYEAYLREEGVG